MIRARGPTGRNAAGAAYLSGFLGVLSSRALSLVAGAASLWLITRILDTAQFAGYSVAMSVAYLIGATAGLGLDRSLVLRIGEIEPISDKLAGAGLLRSISGWVTVLATCAGLVAIALWNWVPALSGDATTSTWLWLLWPIVPAFALTITLVGWYQANHYFGLPQFMSGLSDAARCAGFAAIALLGLGPNAVAIAAILAALLPIAILSIQARGRTLQKPEGLGLSDFKAGIRFVAMRLSAMGMTHVDLLVIGALAPAQAVAQYAVASRFALLIGTGQQLFMATYMPRARRHMSAGHPELARREYHVSRILGLMLTLPVLACLTLVGHSLLDLFGDFGKSYGAFLILMAGHLINLGFGMHSTHLSMTDRLTLATANRLAALVLMVVLLLLLVPGYMITGAAVSFLLAILAYNLIGTLIVFLQEAFVIITPAVALWLSIAAGALLAAAWNENWSVIAATAITASWIGLGIGNAGLIENVLREARRTLLR